MKMFGILAAASLALAPALASADEQKVADQTRPAPGPVASQNDELGNELTPDVVVPIGLGLTGALLLALLAGDGGGDDDTTPTTTTTTTTTSR